VFLETSINFYSNLAINAVLDLRSTQEDLSTGNSKLDETVGTALSFWLNATEGGLSALVAATGTLPTVFLRMGPGDSAPAQDGRVLLPVDAGLEFSGLTQIHRKEPSIGAWRAAN
jgi:hypothetical protein